MKSIIMKTEIIQKYFTLKSEKIMKKETVKEMKETILTIAEKFENSLTRLMESLERQNKKYTDSRLFNMYLGKIFGIIEMLNNLGMEKEAEKYDWAYKYGI